MGSFDGEGQLGQQAACEIDAQGVISGDGGQIAHRFGAVAVVPHLVPDPGPGGGAHQLALGVTDDEDAFELGAVEAVGLGDGVQQGHGAAGGEGILLLGPEQMAVAPVALGGDSEGLDDDGVGAELVGAELTGGGNLHGGRAAGGRCIALSRPDGEGVGSAGSHGTVDGLVLLGIQDLQDLSVGAAVDGAGDVGSPAQLHIAALQGGGEAGDGGGFGRQLGADAQGHIGGGDLHGVLAALGDALEGGGGAGDLLELVIACAVGAADDPAVHALGGGPLDGEDTVGIAGQDQIGCLDQLAGGVGDDIFATVRPVTVTV